MSSLRVEVALDMRCLHSTHDVKHDVVSEARGTVNADQDAVGDGGAEAHRQAVSPGTGTLVVGPGVGDQAPALPKDVGGTRCGGGEEGEEEKEGHLLDSRHQYVLSN